MSIFIEDDLKHLATRSESKIYKDGTEFIFDDYVVFVAIRYILNNLGYKYTLPQIYKPDPDDWEQSYNPNVRFIDTNYPYSKFNEKEK